MCQFLCLLAPGMITWTLSNRYSCRKSENTRTCFVDICNILLFAFIDLAMLGCVFKLGGRTLFVQLENGMPAANYGVRGIIISIAISSALGIAVSFGKKIKLRDIKLNTYFVCCLGILWLFFQHLMQGFRWPSDCVLTCHLISCRFGWLPRSLVGTVGTALFGGNWYQRNTMDIVIIGTAFVFILWFIYECVNYARNKCFVGMILFFIFSFSPYASYYLHEMGYFEQYGYAVCVVLMLFVFPKFPARKNWIICSAAGFVLLFVTESNMFLVVPILCAQAFLGIINDGTISNTKKELCLMGGFLSATHNILYFCLDT